MLRRTLLAVLAVPLFSGCTLVVAALNDAVDVGDGDVGDGDVGDGDVGDGDVGDGDVGDGDTGMRDVGDGDGDEGGDGDGDSQAGDGDGDGDVVPPDCGPGEALTVTALADRFTDEIYPLMTRTAGGCLACHDAGSARQLQMGTTGFDTFHRVRTGGFFTLEPGSMFDRVDRDTMPQGGPFWTPAEKDLLQAFVCEVIRYDVENGAPLDEVFPPELEAPYAGPPPTEYDNTFLTYEQLKGRILTQFGDDWVREGNDRFVENIALFGGVDFENAYIAARGATPEFLVGLDVLAEDVCAKAVADGSGPFVGIDTAAAVLDEPPSVVTPFPASTLTSIDGGGNVAASPFPVVGNPPYLSVYSAGGGRVQMSFPIDGDYTFSVVAQGDEAGPDLPHMELRVGIETPVGWDVPEAPGFQTYEATIHVSAGTVPVDVVFTNDYYDPENPDPNQIDRNLRLRTLTVTGPVPGTTVGAPGASTAAAAGIADVLEAILLRPAVTSGAGDEIAPLYQLLVALESFDGDRAGAWAAVCEGLLRHPDFLFTRPPSADEAEAAERERALVIKTALDLLDRPPTAEELGRYDVGEVDRMALATEWLASERFRDTFFHKMRIVLETDGTPEGDEPARLLTHVFLADRPLRDVLTAEYSVDDAFAEVGRAPEHGATGVLTMPGYIRGKPGLPHYNYAARVLSGFLGYVFEVPPEVFDQRATATAASTVDPTSLCFSCHQVLTPLAHQRLRWDDDGVYQEVGDDGLPIDDSDRGLVEGYPFAGQGLPAFASQAVRKEGFIRRMANLQFSLLFSRPMRHAEDERGLYRTLWDDAAGGEGSFRELLTTILTSEAYVTPVGIGGGAP